MTDILEQKVNTKDYLTKSNLPASDYVINPYVGCPHACKYCYANYSDEKVNSNCQMYNPQSPLLCGTITKEDKITERKMKSLKEGQISIFDL